MSQFISPIKGLQSKQGWDGHYPADSGADINVPVGTEVYAIADGQIIYSERGHTPWGTSINAGIDTPYSVLVKLDAPFIYRGRTYYFYWMTHLSELYINVPDGSTTRPVKMGDKLGKTGLGNKVPHLHLGLIINRQQASEADWMAPATLAALIKTWGDEMPKEEVLEDYKLLKLYIKAPSAIAFEGKIYDIVGANELTLKVLERK